MSELWIANASPIIALAKIDRLDLLPADHRALLIPEAVADEISRSPAKDPAHRALASGWGMPPVSVVPDPDVLEWGLGGGETAVLSLARQKEATAIVDDRAARTACRALEICVIGTLAVVFRG